MDVLFAAFTIATIIGIFHLYVQHKENKRRSKEDNDIVIITFYDTSTGQKCVTQVGSEQIELDIDMVTGLLSGYNFKTMSFFGGTMYLVPRKYIGVDIRCLAHKELG